MKGYDFIPSSDFRDKWFIAWESIKYQRHKAVSVC